MVGDVACAPEQSRLCFVGDALGKVYRTTQPRDFVFQGEPVTGEEWIRLVFTEYLSQADPELSPETLALNLNGIVADQLRRAGMDPERSDEVPGIVGAIGKLGPEKIEICWRGEVAAIGELRDGSLLTSENQVWGHDVELKAIFGEIRQRMATEGKDMAAAWEEFTPTMAVKRRARSNNPHDKLGYGVLNGQAGFSGFVRTISAPSAEVVKVFMQSDGFIMFEDGRLDPRSLAPFLQSLNSEEDLLARLGMVRARQLAEAKTSFIRYPEASAILSVHQVTART